VGAAVLNEAAWWQLLAASPEDEGLWEAFSWWLRDEADDPAGAAWVEWYRRPGKYLGDNGIGPEVLVRHRAPRGPDGDDGQYWWLYYCFKDDDYRPENEVLPGVALHMPDGGGDPWEPGSIRDFPTRRAADEAHLAGWRLAWAAGWRPAP
jgi:hypothetical protein